MLLFSEYDKTLDNIYSSQPVVDINLGDTNNYLVRFPKFKKVTHIILAFDAENLFLKEKSSYGYFFNLEALLSDLEENKNRGYFVVATTSNSSRQKQYNPYPRKGGENFATKHIESILETHLPQICSDYDIEFSNLKKIVMGASMGGLMSIKTSVLYPAFNNIISLSPAFWFGYPGVVNDLVNLSKKSICNISVGTKEEDVFGDDVRNIFPNDWDLDFSNNNNFYISGVERIKKELELNGLRTNFILQDEGKHNETYWNPILKQFLLSI
tara:strand:+ start:613 stop:1419 length:807 start_codon:yes stop_codon:yes gene_type:complete